MTFDVESEAKKAHFLAAAYKSGRISKRTLKQALKRVKKELKRVTQEIKEANDQVKILSSKIDDLKFIGKETFDKMNITDVDQFNGIYIVSKKDQKNVTEMTNFSDLVKDEIKPRRISIDNLPTGVKGPDGLPVDTTLGALLVVTNLGKVFHFANVAPATPEAQLQVEYALWKLNLGIKPKGVISREVIDGHFRQHLTKKALEN